MRRDLRKTGIENGGVESKEKLRISMYVFFFTESRPTLSEMYIVNFTTVNTPHISPHVSPQNVVIQGPVKFT